MNNGNFKIPYGVSDFKRLRREGYYFVDKSAYIRTLEQCGSFLFFVRPRRFGKSLFLDMLRCSPSKPRRACRHGRAAYPHAAEARCGQRVLADFSVQHKETNHEHDHQ